VYLNNQFSNPQPDAELPLALDARHSAHPQIFAQVSQCTIISRLTTFQAFFQRRHLFFKHFQGPWISKTEFKHFQGFLKAAINPDFTGRLSFTFSRLVTPRTFCRRGPRKLLSNNTHICHRSEDPC